MKSAGIRTAPITGGSAQSAAPFLARQHTRILLGQHREPVDVTVIALNRIVAERCLHLGVPAAGLVSEMTTGFHKIVNRDFTHFALPFLRCDGLFLRFSARPGVWWLTSFNFPITENRSHNIHQQLANCKFFPKFAVLFPPVRVAG